MNMNYLNRNEVDARYDNSDILTPSSALTLMTDRIMQALQDQGINISERLLNSKKGEVNMEIPVGFKPSALRDIYFRIQRLLPIKESGAPFTPNIREEFEVAAVTAHRNKSHHLFYIEAMLRAFKGNLSINIKDSALAYELRQMRNANGVTKEDAAVAYTAALDNVMRFHPLYVAYLYEASGDKARADILMTEAIEYMAWLYRS